MASNGQLPASNGAAHNGYDKAPNGSAVSSDRTAARQGGKGLNLLYAALLAVAVALSAAPVAGYKSGWVYYRKHNYTVPPIYQIPVPITLKFWVGWIKGTNSVTNILHSLAPDRIHQYVYLRDVRESGQVIGGLAIAFLLVGGLVSFLYFLACLVWALIGHGRRSAHPPGMSIALLIFGFFNMAWSIACYIVIAVGTAIYARRNLGATYIGWPDWCFYLAFFSGVFMWITAFLSLAGRRRTRHKQAAAPHMTHNMAYNNPPGTMHEPKAAAV